MRHLAILFAIVVAPAATAVGQEHSQWTHYGGSTFGMQYSSLSQINRENVGKLREVWRFRTGELGQRANRPFAFQANPVHLSPRALELPTQSGILNLVRSFDPSIARVE